MTRLVCALVAMLAGAGLAAEKAPTVRMGADAAVRLDGDDACLQFVLFTPGGTYLETVNETAARVSPDLSVSYKFIYPLPKVLAAGRATLCQRGKAAVFEHAMTAHAPIVSRSPGFVLRLRASAFKDLKGRTDGKTEGKSFEFDFPSKRKWTIAFPKPMTCEVVDMRPFSRDEFVVRFILPEKLSLLVGKGCDATCTLTASDGAPQVGARDFHGIGQGADWVKLDVEDGIRPSSALDFSRLMPRRGVAGTEGALVATTNGEFRFSRKVSEPRRLFGCCVATKDLFVPKKASTEYAKLLARSGYNAMRLTRFGDRLKSDDAEKFDQLVTVAGREGIYSVLDIVGLRAWRWDELGLPEPAAGDEPSPSMAALLFCCNDRAFESWKRVATSVYGRKNVIGRRTYGADPAVPMVLALADMSPFGAWFFLRTQPFLQERYGGWLAEKRKTDPDFMKGRVCEVADLEIMPLYEQKAASVRQFLAECEISGLARMKTHLASLGSKALVGATLGAYTYRDVAALRATAGDFTCDSFSFDPPHHLGSVVSRINNSNPLLRASPIPASVAWHERPDVAMCITSWGHPGPSSWRAATGLLVGAWAGKHHWSAVFRGSDPGVSPIVAATERAVFALFARGDMSPDAPDDALVIEKGALTVKTPRTVGGFSPEPNGRIVAEPLTVTLKGARAAVWVSALGDGPVAKSKRLLLTHLTEAQTEGTLFADSHGDLLMRRGTGPLLLRDGSAVIELAVKSPSTFKVFALGTDGTRSVRIPTEVKNGVLTFVASVRGSRNAQYLYEITRE